MTIAPERTTESADAGRQGPPAVPRAGEPTVRRRRANRRRRIRRVHVVDTLVLGATVVGSYLHTSMWEPSVRGLPSAGLALGVVLAVWLIALRLGRTDRPAVVGSGDTEYIGVVIASIVAFAIAGAADTLTSEVLSAPFWIGLAVVGVPALVVSRMCGNHLERRTGRAPMSVLVVGTTSSVAEFVGYADANPELGYEPVGVFLAGSSPGGGRTLVVEDRELAVLGDLTDAVSNEVGITAPDTRIADADAVVLTSVDMFDRTQLRELSWRSAAVGMVVIVAPPLFAGLSDRIAINPHDGLLRIEPPRHEYATSWAKRAFDLLGAGCITVLALSVLLACAAAVKLGDGGPVFYRAERIGLNNETFRMWKFRTMRVGADAMRDDLATQTDGNGVLFKMRDDPRVTRVGRFLRRTSLDELPQVFNVLGGSMSLVGPRPPLAEEVAPTTIWSATECWCVPA
ncbi:hypothetical protein BJF87_19660 [Gordonia sp. CNJ-863]|uniref:sugar transferase n=1 Tax=Gordonia sp. CNJ-863 TaxID=1904963 RepID=UPI0009664B65|nr:sugar transferase [Gordonia sp. CNJ-863]OLT48653.1 hypothetical protein BJF87_19660 [Gordonia sp. CNJ-863]